MPGGHISSLSCSYFYIPTSDSCLAHYSFSCISHMVPNGWPNGQSCELETILQNIDLAQDYQKNGSTMYDTGLLNMLTSQHAIRAFVNFYDIHSHFPSVHVAPLTNRSDSPDRQYEMWGSDSRN